MEEKNVLKFVIVGSVDHGKSTLIGRLLFDTHSLPLEKIEEMKKISRDLNRKTEFAFLLDHLQEEREQGITIDTTQMFFKTPEREYVIIDAPGHVEFVKNMITGASQAEAAILIIDADEGIKEQTKRHANILSMIGIKQVVVVVNKMDLVNRTEEAFNKIRTEAIKFLEAANIKPDYFIPISALDGDNVANKSSEMTWYEGPTVLEALASFKNMASLSEKQLIFPIQDVYRVEEKRIFVGRIESGRMKVGEEISVLPDVKSTYIKSIEVFNENRNDAICGESIGITTTDPLFIERGNVICEKGKELSASNDIRANVFWMGKEPLKEKETITLKCATQEVTAEIYEIKKRVNSSSLEVVEDDAKQLDNLEVGEIFIKTKKPIVTTKFDDIEELGRFVLIKNENIVAGGIII